MHEIHAGLMRNVTETDDEILLFAEHGREDGGGKSGTASFPQAPLMTLFVLPMLFHSPQARGCLTSGELLPVNV